MVGYLLSLGLALLLELDRRQGDVLEGRHVGIEVELLENHGTVGPYQMDPVAVENLLAVEVNLPLRRLFQGIDTTDQGAFAGTRGADDGNLLPFPDMEINILEGL
jgi:hypothetical protein